MTEKEGVYVVLSREEWESVIFELTEIHPSYLAANISAQINADRTKELERPMFFKSNEEREQEGPNAR